MQLLAYLVMALVLTAPGLPVPARPQLVAHAGGAAGTLRYTNSLEALESSYAKKFTVFEIDLETTADDEIVLLHDWEYSIKNFFHAPPDIYTLDKFKELQLHDGLTTMTFAELAAWIEARPETYVITDFKRRQLRSLKKISEKYPHLRERIIPQIYHAYEYWPVRALGYRNIILTLYATDYSDAAVVNFSLTHPLWAVAMPSERAQKGSLPNLLHIAGIPTYAHLVDTPDVRDHLSEKGVYGFYTAYLEPIGE